MGLTAALPSVLIDVGAFFTIVGVVTGTCVALWRTPLTWPLRWLSAKVVESLAQWFKAQVSEANADDSKALSDLSERFEEHRRYVSYHLGPNGTTKPVHERLCTVERAVAQNEGDPS